MLMTIKVGKFVSAIAFAGLILLAITACRSRIYEGQIDPPQKPAQSQQSRDSLSAQTGVNTNIGFRSRRNLEEHYQKHGQEFGEISRDEYLRQAQALRDAPVGGNILEAKREDNTTSRFDRSSGAFIAFNEDLTIRTFFKPNDGERYFKRQINRAH